MTLKAVFKSAHGAVIGQPLPALLLLPLCASTYAVVASAADADDSPASVNAHADIKNQIFCIGLSPLSTIEIAPQNLNVSRRSLQPLGALMRINTML
jgi:hypothetical protein